MTMNDLEYIIKIATLKRSAIEFFLDNNREYKGSKYLIGQYDALAQIIGEIERLYPGIVTATLSPIDIVANKWNQHEAERGLAALFDGIPNSDFDDDTDSEGK
jgi:hypothetical protein